MEHFLEDFLVAWSNCENHRAIYRRRRHAPPAATSPSTCPQAPRRFLSPFGSFVSVTMCYIAPLCALMLFFAAAPRFAALRRRPSSGAHPSPPPPLTVSSLFFLTALIAALLVVMSLICAFCSYDGATNQRELGQHVRYCGARYCGARYCGAATSPGGGDGGAPRAIVGGGGGGIGGGGGGDGDGGASYDAVAAMDTSQVLPGSAEASLVQEFDWEGGGDGGEAGR